MAQRVDMTIDAGSTFEFSMKIQDDTGNDVDLSGYNARSQMRRHYSSINAISFEANIEANNIVLRLTANNTTNIMPGRYVYDVEIEDDLHIVTRVIEGIVTVTPNATR